MKKRLLIIVLLTLPLLILAVLYIDYRIGLQPAVQTGSAREFSIEVGRGAPAIARQLEAEGFIRSHTSFITYVNLHGLRPRLKAGQYLIDPTQSAAQIAELLASGRTLARRLTVPEGYTLQQIQAQAVANGIKAEDFQAALAAPRNQSFLASKPTNVSLEGYLFPDSYELNSTTTATQLVDSMLTTFSERVSTEYVAAFAAQGLNLHQGLTLASMVEREVNIEADRPVVAQIFLSRLKLGQSLGSDVTTEYAAQLLGVPFNINIDSPYNTRRYTGLPPGPICNPGLSALNAVARPATTDYLYFLSGKDGKTYFAKTYAEHQRNIAKYL